MSVPEALRQAHTARGHAGHEGHPRSQTHHFRSRPSVPHQHTVRFGAKAAWTRGACAGSLALLFDIDLEGEHANIFPTTRYWTESKAKICARYAPKPGIAAGSS